jgi:uncharacterized protein (TIGR03905 family)
MIEFDVEGGVLRHVNFIGGCDGNLQGISNLVEGMKVERRDRRLKGIDCGGRAPRARISFQRRWPPP